MEEKHHKQMDSAAAVPAKATTKVDPMDWVWEPELLLVGWLGASFVLVTLSLLFYHMTRVSSLEMSPRLSGIFSVCLIVCSVILTGIAIFTYDARTRNIMRRVELDDKSRKQENAFKRTHTVICVFIMMIQLGIVLTIAMGTLKESQRNSSLPSPSRFFV